MHARRVDANISIMLIYYVPVRAMTNISIMLIYYVPVRAITKHSQTSRINASICTTSPLMFFFLIYITYIRYIIDIYDYYYTLAHPDPDISPGRVGCNTRSLSYGGGGDISPRGVGCNTRSLSYGGGGDISPRGVGCNTRSLSYGGGGDISPRGVGCATRRLVNIFKRDLIAVGTTIIHYICLLSTISVFAWYHEFVNVRI